VTNLEAVRLEAFRQSLIEIARPDDELAAHLNRVYLRHRFEDVELYEDSLPVLSQLSHSFIIGLLSNGNSYPERLGLGDLFRFIVLSQDHGVEEPDPRIFQIGE
jgi:FMN phosphatase YigB (HAD superfamily)